MVVVPVIAIYLRTRPSGDETTELFQNRVSGHRRSDVESMRENKRDVRRGGAVTESQDAQIPSVLGQWRKATCKSRHESKKGCIEAKISEFMEQDKNCLLPAPGRARCSVMLSCHSAAVQDETEGCRARLMHGPRKSAVHHFLAKIAGMK